MVASCSHGLHGHTLQPLHKPRLNLPLQHAVAELAHPAIPPGEDLPITQCQAVVPSRLDVARRRGQPHPPRRGLVSHRGRTLQQLVEDLGALVAAPGEDRPVASAGKGVGLAARHLEHWQGHRDTRNLQQLGHRFNPALVRVVATKHPQPAVRGDHRRSPPAHGHTGSAARQRLLGGRPYRARTLVCSLRHPRNQRAPDQQPARGSHRCAVGTCSHLQDALREQLARGTDDNPVPQRRLSAAGFGACIRVRRCPQAQAAVVREPPGEHRAPVARRRLHQR
mmetsp:Transcript_648/g.1295  ORF Transcript_648/g.1295 Transcript_648/m.1295 type:complete len:280 (-) Transcript_648:544-1383(-)